MSWYGQTGISERWTHRIAFVVYNASATGSYDMSVQIPADLDEFWEIVRSSGEDVRVTVADGLTPVSVYYIDSLNTTTRVGTLKLQSQSLTTVKTTVFWLYWGNASCSTAMTSFSASSPKTAYFELAEPAGQIVPFSPVSPGETKPKKSISKTPSETIFVWFDLKLMRRASTFGSSRLYEEPQEISYTIETGGTDVTSTIGDQTSVRVSGHMVKISLAGGTDDVGYTVYLTIYTSAKQTLQGTALLRVAKPDEA